VKVTDVPAQTVVAEAEMETLAARTVLTVMVMGTEVAGLPLIHAALEVITTVTTSLFEGVYENEALLEPASVPFTFHWNEGFEPPLLVVALKLTSVPAQTVVVAVDTETPTGRIGLTIMVIGLAEAGFPETQVSLEFRVQVTTSLFNGV
jgi:hypothetical protein